MQFMVLCAYLVICYIHHGLALKTQHKNQFEITSKNPKNEKYKNHNMDGWVPIMPTLEYVQLKQRRNCVSVGYYNADCEDLVESKVKPNINSKYKSLVDSLNRNYRSPYGNHVTDIVPKLPNHYTNPIPRYVLSNHRNNRRFSNPQSTIQLPRFIEEYPTNKFGQRIFQKNVPSYWRNMRGYYQYPMLEPIPGQILYPPSVPRFKANPLNEISLLKSRYSNDIAHSRTKGNIKTITSTMYPFFEHASVPTKKSFEMNNKHVKNNSRFDTTSPAFAMVIEPTTIKTSSTTTISTKPIIKPSTAIVPPIQIVYSVTAKPPTKQSKKPDSGFQKEIPKKVVLESPPKLYSDYERESDDIISTKLNRFFEYTTSGYSVYVTIKPLLERPDKDESNLIDNIAMTHHNQTNVKIIPLSYPREDDTDNDNSINVLKSPIDSKKNTYFAKNTGFKKYIKGNSTKTTLRPIIYTLSSLLLDTDNQSSSHQLSKPGQYYVDHLSSTINDHDLVGKRSTVQLAEALKSNVTIMYQPPLPNKSNNQNTTNSRWTQPHELYAINNNDGINDRDQKIKDINLDIVITTDGPTINRNQIYENKNYLGINDGDEWNDGNVDGNSRALSGYGRVNVEPNVKWIMVAKSSKLDKRNQNSRSIRMMSSSYRDFIIPMTKKEMPKVNNSNIVLGTQFLVQ